MWTTNRRDGGRWGTWAGVVPAARAAGVAIRPDTTAVRLVFDGTRCTGAEVTAAGTAGPGPYRGGATEVIRAGRVIVCAGAYGSPSCCSGPASVPSRCSRRSDHAVSVLAGVGANVQDHPWCLLNVDVTDGP